MPALASLFRATLRHNRVVLHGSVAAAFLIVTLGALVMLLHMRQQDEMDSAATTRNLAATQQQSFDGLFDTLDVALLACSEEIGRQLSLGKLDQRSITRYFARHKEQLSHVAFLRGADERGAVIYGPGAVSPPAHIADRDYFIHQRDGAAAGLFFGKPVIGRIDRQWVWIVSRRISKTDGSFGGVVYAGIHIEAIDQLLSQIKLAPGGIVALRDAEMGLVARNTMTGVRTVPIGDKRISNAFVAARNLDPWAGTFVSDKSSADGVRRTVSYRRSAKHGFTLLVGVDADAELAEWRRQAWIVTGLVGGLFLAALALVATINRAWRRQESYMAALDTSQNFNEQIVSASPIGIMTYDASGQCLSANRNAADLVGAQPEQMLQQNFRHIESWKRAGLLASAEATLASGAPTRSEFHLQSSFGKDVWLDAVFARFVSAGAPRLLLMCVDASQRKRQEEKTRQLLAENETILHNALVGIVYIKQGRIVLCNRRFEEIFRYEPGALAGLAVAALYDTPANFQAVMARAHPQLQRAQNHSEELLLRRQDGELFWGAINGCAIDAAAPDDGSIWIYADISQRRRAEQQLEEHQTRLEELVRERTGQLQEALEAAKAADKSKDEFLTNITHELRTPLAAVIGFSSLARQMCSDLRQIEYLEKVNSAGKTLAGIIDDLLDLSKVAAGRMTLEARPFSLTHLVARSRSVISFKAAEKGLELRDEIAADVPDVLVGDSLRLEQILLNLLSNAVKFTAAGHVALRIGLQAREAQRLCLDIAVTDTGIGIGAEEIALLFKPFSQADASVTRRFGGTGLGLAICKHLAELMDGEIAVSSDKGAGTTFRVRLWLGIAAPDARPAGADVVPDAAPVRYQDARVLVVEDQPFNRDVVAGLLAAVGITPHLASDGQEALDLLALAAEAFDLVLMDIQMPLMDGLTATRVIRQIDGLAQLPIIAMTAHTMTHEKEKCFAAGMNDHVGKPFDEAGFYRVLAKWLPRGKRRLQAAGESPPSASGFPELQGVDTRAGLSLLQGDEARYRYWLGNFADEAPATIQAIRQALAEGAVDAARLAAHALKGRTGLLGMKELHGIAAALEAGIDQARPTDTLLVALEQGLAAMGAEIRRGLGATSHQS